MKNKLVASLALAWLSFLNPELSTLLAQGTAFTYQGRLNGANGPATGTYDITLTLFDAATGGAVIGPSNAVTSLVISNGLFTVTPDFGPQFNGLDRWLEIAVRTNGGSAFALLSPRQKLTPTPYAFYAPQAGTATTAFGVTADAVGASGLQSSSVTSDKVADGSITAVDVNSASFSNTFWKVNGNAGANPAGGAFLGTTDNRPLDFRVNGVRALRLEPTASSNSVNVIGGWGQNSVSPGAEGATIAGGGINGFPNTITAGYATIGGGTFNTVAGGWATIAGGRDNKVTGNYSIVSGGTLNTIQTNSDAATIGGGDENVIQSASVWSTIGGGRLNVVDSNIFSATIAGGEKNAVLANGSFASIGGGLLNSAASDYAIIGGGNGNTIQTNATHATISGGAANTIRSNSWRGTIGGGVVNAIGAPEGTVAGGAFNSALGFSATIGGGGGNTASGEWATIAGGRDNLLNTAHYATIGGGLQNTIQSNGFAATIPGGWLNSATSYGFAAGRRAKANHTGAFVWADATDADHSSTGTNQFLIRASGGVGINNNNPNGAALAVNGDVNVEGIISANALSTASATTPQVNTPRLGTTAPVPLELYVNDQRGLRLEPTGSPNTVNVIGGSLLNSVGDGVLGATIGGGGSGNYLGSTYANQVDGDFGTVSGGGENKIQANARFGTISGGSRNMIQPDVLYGAIGGGSENRIQTNASFSTIAGGDRNLIQPNTDDAFIGGGRANKIEPDGDLSTISGGRENTIQDHAAHAVIGGGGDNIIQTNGQYATIPGGRENSATNYAFAAGRRAKANRTGAFVWADSTDADFTATGNNQFLVRAAGGMGIGTPNPQGSLHVYSANNPTVVRVQSTGTPGFGRLEFVSNPQGDVNEWRPGYIQSTDNGGFVGGLAFFVNGAGPGNKFGNNEVMRVVNGAVGIGTGSPVSALQVIGTVTATAFNPPSDRNLKENFIPVSPREILEKVTAMPISRWNFKSDPAVPHVGPMAQDFHAAFNLGTDERHIATVDADGVALAAIQGLNQKVEGEIVALRSENAELKKRLENLERLLKREDQAAR